jgi:Secretion system C-terminal sorting domain
MKKIYTLSLLLAFGLSFGQAFTGTYPFSNVTSTSGLIDPTPVPVVTGLTFGAFSAKNPVAINPNAGSRFSFDNQPTGATANDNVYANLTGSLDPNTYFEVTITPNTGTTYSLTGITFTSQRSGTGIRTYSVRSSADNYSTNLSASINPANAELSVQTGNIFYRVLDAITTAQNGSTITLNGSSFTDITTAITFRFYGWNSEASGGTFSIDNVALSGNISVLGVKSNTISGLQIYPNPAKSILNITSNNSEIKQVAIYNILGKQVLATKATNTPINIAILDKGVYMIKITEEGKTATKKLVIE